jgi:hypothetical protein
MKGVKSRLCFKGLDRKSGSPFSKQMRVELRTRGANGMFAVWMVSEKGGTRSVLSTSSMHTHSPCKTHIVQHPGGLLISTYTPVIHKRRQTERQTERQNSDGKMKKFHESAGQWKGWGWWQWHQQHHRTGTIHKFNTGVEEGRPPPPPPSHSHTHAHNLKGEAVGLGDKIENVSIFFLQLVEEVA